jgi:hypothetical protein
MCRGSSLGGVEGPRHAGNDYAGERFIAQHGSGTLLSTRGVILRLSLTGETDKRFSDLRIWHDFYDRWRPLTNASTSGPNCSSLRAPMPGIATSAASSVGNVSAIAINVLSVNTT